MSSILKALKKLENQAANEDPVRLWRQKYNVPDIQREHLDDRRRFNKRHIIIFTGVIFAAGIGLVLSHKFLDKKPALTPKSETGLQKTVRLPVMKPESTPTSATGFRKPIRIAETKPESTPTSEAGLQDPARLPAKKLESTSKPDAALEKPVRIAETKSESIPKPDARLQKPLRMAETKSESTPTSEAGLRNSTGMSETQPAVTSKVQKELSSRKFAKNFDPLINSENKVSPPADNITEKGAVMLSKKTSPVDQAPKETIAEKRGDNPEQNARDDQFASVPVKRSNETKIEVQAIAWSIDPKSRLAVVNGLILRERESVDNVTVLHIGKDAVIFKKGREEWKQMFGL